MSDDRKLLYRIETSYAGSLEGGRFLDLAWGLSMIDALDEWAAKHGGYEALGIAAEDVIAHETDADPPSSAPAPPQS